MLDWRDLTVLVLAASAVAGCGKRERIQAGSDVAKAISAENVKQETVQRSIEVVGTLVPVDEATVSSEAEGTVASLHADLGDHVKAGRVLVELDREKAQYLLDQQKAALARALAQLGAVDTAHLPPVEQTPDVQKAEAELAQAKQAFTRAEELHKRQLIPQQTLDDADTARRSKQASYDSALQNAKNLKANMDATDASMKLADRQLRDASIRAPFDGYVSQRMVNLGQFVKNQTPVMSLVRVNPLKVTAEIPEKMAPWIQVGQVVTLHVDAYPDKAIAGTLSRISPSVNTATRAFLFEALVPNADASLKPGTFARVHIESNRVDQVMTVSTAAIQYRYGVNRVFVIEKDRLVAHELKIGDRVGNRIEVISGVKPGDPIAVTDVDRLVDGQHVSSAE